MMKSDYPGEGHEDAPLSKEEAELLADLKGMRISYDKKTMAPKAPTEPTGEIEFFNEEAVQEATAKWAVDPFKGAIFEPTKPPAVNPAEPAENYQLEYAYGFRCHDCRQNLYFTKSGSLAYNVAALGIIHNPTLNSQTFFGGKSLQKGKVVEQHDNDIICLAMSPDRGMVATGQEGVKPTVYIWKTIDGSFVGKCVIPEKNTRAILGVTWISDGQHIACVDRHNEFNVYVYDINGTRKGTKKSGASEVFDISASKKPGDPRFATCGKRHINFWDSKTMDMKKGTGISAGSFTCCTFDVNGICYAGSLTGEVFVFKGGNSLTTKFKAHSGYLLSINWVGGELLSGGKDAKVNVWDGTNYKLKQSLAVGSPASALDALAGNIAVGTKDGTVALYKGGKQEKVVMKSHHDGELWGLETADKYVITTCDDNKIMLWDPAARACVGTFTLDPKPGHKIKYGASSLTSLPDNQCSRSICYNNRSGDIAIATNAGGVHIRTLKTLGVDKNYLQCGDRWIEVMAYSPNGNYFAVGTHSSLIHIFKLPDYAPYAVLKGNSSSILNIDWSKDSRVLRTVSESYELLFYDVESKLQNASGGSAYKDLEWATCSCKFGWGVQGIFPPYKDYTHVNTVCLSESGKLLLTGDDDGLVNIYRYPVRDNKLAQARALKGHSEHVMRVKFAFGDTKIFSAGGQDKALLQWKKA